MKLRRRELSKLLKTTQLKNGKVRLQTRSDSQTMPLVRLQLQVGGEKHSTETGGRNMGGIFLGSVCDGFGAGAGSELVLLRSGFNRETSKHISIM